MKQLILLALALGLTAGAGAQSVTMVSGLDDAGLLQAFSNIYKEAKIDLKIEVIPPARVFGMVDDGVAVGFVNAEGVIAKSYKTKVVRIGFGEAPLATLKIIAWVRTADLEKYKDRTSWAGARVGHVLGAPVTKQFADLSGSKVLVEANSYDSALKMLDGKRFDIIFATDGLLEGNESGLAVAKLPAPVANIPYWHVIPEKYAGTPFEKSLRAAFVKHKAEFEKALTAFLTKK